MRSSEKTTLFFGGVKKKVKMWKMVQCQSSNLVLTGMSALLNLPMKCMRNGAGNTAGTLMTGWKRNGKSNGLLKGKY